MTLKKTISLILFTTILSTTLPVVSFAEETEQISYAPNRASYEDFDPEATQEPFSYEPIVHTEIVPSTFRFEDEQNTQGENQLNESTIIGSLLPEVVTDSTLSTTSTTSDAAWNSLMAERFGDDYLSPFKKSDGQTVSGRTNRLTIRETDLSLPGKNGLDVNIRRYHNNQYYNEAFMGVNTKRVQYVTNVRYVYAFIDTSTNQRVYIGFLTNDDFYLYNMFNGITISEYPSSDDVYSMNIDNQSVDCYCFEFIYEKQADDGAITLVYDSTFTPIGKGMNYPDGSPAVVYSYPLLPRSNTLGYDWEFEMPGASLYEYASDNTDYGSYTIKIKDYVGAFRDIDGTVHRLRGTGNLKTPNMGDITYTSSIQSSGNKFLNFTQYLAVQTLGETEIQYNFTIFDSGKGITYYMYNQGVQPDAVLKMQQINIIAIADRYGNMIQYKYDSEYKNVTQIVDTYGRVINFSITDTAKELSYTDEKGIVQTIKYEMEELPASELNNDSPIKGKNVQRLKVTNAQGETTTYDSRKTEVIAYFCLSKGVPLYGKTCNEDYDIETAISSNIERIIYPNGSETRYLYDYIYTTNQGISISQSNYAVKESYDIVNGVKKNIKTFGFTVEDGEIKKTETNSSNGCVTVYNYDIDGMLIEETASATGNKSGSYIANYYAYGTNNQITRHTINNSGLSRATNYTYIDNYPGLLSSVQENDRSKTIYTYHKIDGKITLIPSIVSIYGYNGSYYQLDYSIETTLDSSNRAVEYEKIIKDKVIESQIQYVYDDYGRIIAVTQWVDDTNGDGVLDINDDTVTTSTQYAQNADGSITVSDSVGNISTTYKFGVTGLPYSMTDPKGYTTQVEYDNVGRATKYSYPNGATETADYNITSMFTNVKDKAGEYTWTYFSQSGLPTSKHFSNSQWTQFEKFEYDTADRLIYKKSIYDVDKFTAERYTYDVLDRVASKQVYDNDALLYVESYTYGYTYIYTNGYGRRYSTTTKTTIAEDGTAVADERETVDNYGRVTKKELYTSDGVNITTSYTYDYRGNVLTETDPMGNVTVYTYDIFNNVASVTYPDGSQEHMYYDMLGRNTTVVDRNSVEYRNIYDELGRVTETQVNVDGTYVTLTRSYYDANSNITTKCTNINPQSNTGAMTFTYITYSYDNMNNLVGVSEDDGSDGRVTQYWYDAAGRMTKMATGLPGYYSDTTLPDTARITQYGYDIHGNMTSRTDQLGNVTTYTYDYAGNVKTETRGSTIITKTYGPYGITSSTVSGNSSYDDYTYTYNSIGMMNSHTSARYNGQQLKETIDYDAFGRKISETSNGRTHLYSYDLNSRITNYQMKNGPVVENDIDYTYDSMGRTTLMDINDTSPVGTIIAGTQIAYTYDTSGNLTSKVQGTNRTEITYNLYNQPIIYTNWVGNRALSSYEYTYNWKGNILSEIDAVRQYDKLYTYNAWDDLVTETYRYNGDVVRQTNYTYDRADNRTSKTVTGDENYTKTYTYNKKNQLLTETKTENDVVTEVYTYQYGTRGERSTKYRTVNGTTNPVCYYAWDANGHLLQSDGSTVASYSYDALGRRIEKNIGGETIDYTWSGDNVMAEINCYDEFDHRYTYGVDGIAMDHTLYGLETSYYFKNAHGDVTDVVDADDTTTGVYRYEAFGGKTASPTDDTNPFQYCGEYTDSESGLIYLRNRYYDPQTGAFISEDPIYDGTNWYIYCENNPVNYVDPLGLDEQLDDYINQNYAGKMTVTIAISRPVLNSREVATVTSNGNLDNGHTFLRLDNGSGYVNYIGFAPATKSLTDMLLSKDVEGVFVDDSMTEWDIAKVYEVTPDSFDLISQYINNYYENNKEYNIETYNCTTFAVEAMRYGGINAEYMPVYKHSWTLPSDLKRKIANYEAKPKMIPSSVASGVISWSMGNNYGYTPADVAQDLIEFSNNVLTQKKDVVEVISK